LFLHHDNAPAHSPLRVSQFLAGKGISAVDHPPCYPDLAPADSWLFPELKSVLKGKRFLDVEGIKSSVKKMMTDTPGQDLKTILNNGRSAGNTVKNCREFTSKKSKLLISAALKIFF
jgi:hypothetical protein